MAQHDHPDHSGAAIASVRVEPYSEAALVLITDAIDANGRLDRRYAGEEDDISPPLSWEGAPAETASFALLVEDPDAPTERPVVHWMMWDIPAGTSGLPEAVEKTALPAAVPGAVQGLNSHGRPGWMGMAPPEGHGPHRYHFQLFALGKMLDMPPETTLDELVNALKGNTLALTVTVGTYERGADARSPARTGSYGSDPREAEPPLG
jgi:Raf kinase inhibitor-like YbhB/YbcL family protein